jgi:hypothetical protein
VLGDPRTPSELVVGAIHDAGGLLPSTAPRARVVERRWLGGVPRTLDAFPEVVGVRRLSARQGPERGLWLGQGSLGSEFDDAMGPALCHWLQHVGFQGGPRVEVDGFGTPISSRGRLDH